MTNIAYVVGEFPSVTENFILREIITLRKLGFGIHIMAIKRGHARIPYQEAKGLLPVTYWQMDNQDASTSLSPKLLARKLIQLLSSGQCKKVLRVFPVAIPGTVLHPGSWLRGVRNLVLASECIETCCVAGVVHVHAHFACLPADIGLTLSKILGVGFSFSAHALDIYTMNRTYLLKKVKHARFIACCTAHGQDFLRRMFPDVPQDRFVLVRHGLLIEDFLPPHLLTDRGEPLIVGVGRLEPKKGFVHLIRACAILAERNVQFKCRIAGDGTLMQTLEQEIRRLGVADMVTLTGELPLDGVRNLLKQADVFVMPSVPQPDGDCDGIPNAMLEAMAMGTAVVATSVGGIAEVIRDGVNGLLVSPSSPCLLADRIQDLLTNKERRMSIALAGRKTVFDEFYAPRNIIGLAELFRTSVFQTARHS